MKRIFVSLLCWLLAVAPVNAEIRHIDPDTGLTLYARVNTTGTTYVACALTEGSSGALKNYIAADAALVSAGVGTAGALPYTIRVGSPSATADDPIRGVGTLYWNGSAEVPPTALLSSGTGTGQLSISNGVVSADAVKVSGDSTAADNMESANELSMIHVPWATSSTASGSALSAAIGSATDAVVQVDAGLYDLQTNDPDGPGQLTLGTRLLLRGRGKQATTIQNAYYDFTPTLRLGNYSTVEDLTWRSSTEYGIAPSGDNYEVAVRRLYLETDDSCLTNNAQTGCTMLVDDCDLVCNDNGSAVEWTAGLLVLNDVRMRGTGAVTKDILVTGGTVRGTKVTSELGAEVQGSSALSLRDSQIRGGITITGASATVTLSNVEWDRSQITYASGATSAQLFDNDIAPAILADTGTDGVVVAAGSKTGYSLATSQAFNNTGTWTGNIGGNLTGTVNGINGITFPSAFDTLTVANIQNGLATSAAQTAMGTAITNMYTAYVLDGSVWKLTPNALEDAPTGTGGFTSDDRTALLNASGDTDDILEQLDDAPTLGDAMDEQGYTAALATKLDTNVDGPVSGAGGNGALLTTTIATLTDQTHFTLTAGSTDNDAYNKSKGVHLVITDQSTATQQSVVGVLDYTGSTRAVELADTPVFTIAAGDTVEVMAGGVGDDTAVLAAISGIEISAAGLISPLNPDTDDVWNFDGINQLTSPNILRVLRGEDDKPVGMRFTRPMNNRASLQSVTSVTFTPSTGAPTVVGTPAKSPDAKDAYFALDCTSATAGTYTVTVKVLTTDSVTIIRKGVLKVQQ